MSKWLKDNLPKGFKKSKAIKGAYDSKQNGIVQSIRIEKSDFLDGDDKWVIIINVSVHDVFWIYDADNSAMCVAELSVVDNQVILLDRWDQITHWGLEDLDGVKHTLDSVVLPWLDWFTASGVFVDYLKSLENLDSVNMCSEAIAKYGSVLIDKIDDPARTRKYFNGAIASVYYELNDYDSAIIHLQKHREFVVSDHKPTKIQEINESYTNTLKLVDEGLEELKQKVC